MDAARHLSATTGVQCTAILVWSTHVDVVAAHLILLLTVLVCLLQIFDKVQICDHLDQLLNS